MNDLVKRARDLAYRAHGGQVDKAGASYYEHVARVAEAVSDDPKAQAVGFIHDVFEDHPELHRQIHQFPADVIRAVMLLTKSADESLAEYYAAIRRDPLALRVKLADIADNANEERLALLDPKTANRLREKYRKALEALT